MAWTSGQRYLAEFLGTFGLLLAVGGAAIFSSRLSGGALTSARTILISFSLGAGVIGMVYAFGDISGAHLNPAVTIGMWVSGRIDTKEVVPYILSQVAGGVVAMGLIAGIAYGYTPLFQSAQAGALASQGYSGNGSPYLFSWGAVFLLEVAFTFFLVLVILFATRSENFSKNLAPIGIGLTLLMTNLVAIPVDGASINPARSFAPAVLSAFWPQGQWAIQQDWIFWVAPILGGVIAALVARALPAHDAS
jgi:aquaporin Z